MLCPGEMGLNFIYRTQSPLALNSGMYATLTNIGFTFSTAC